jgi:histone deacetylase 6
VAAALYAAGGTIEATRAVVSGDLESAVAVVRPPGHHSECGCAMGFGIFNSVAIAAADALASGLERVLIVDWDIHHGNGTQGHFQYWLQYV